MKTRLILALAISAVLLLVLALTANAVGGKAAAAPSGPDSAANPLTVNLYLGSGDVSTLDPAHWEETMSGNVIEQLFIGLVDLDDETAKPMPELATSWDVSPD